MGVNVNEPGSNDRAESIDFFWGLRRACTNEGDLSGCDFDVGSERFRAGSVNDAATADDEVW